MLVFCFSVSTLAAITRGYNTDDDDLRPGMVASLSADSTPQNPKVERASRDEEGRVIGVITTPDDSLVTIGTAEQGIYVEVDGEVDAYVVDLDGDVQQGDLLALSPLRGILTKAAATSRIIAIAVEDFNAEEAELYPVEDGGRTKDVRVQQIKVNLDPKAIASLSGETESPLARLGRAIIGKDVGEIRVLIAMIIFFIVLVAEGTIIYGAISSAISSMGRNPLAGNIIRQELIRVLVIALAVLGLGLAAVYAVLSL